MTIYCRKCDIYTKADGRYSCHTVSRLCRPCRLRVSSWYSCPRISPWSSNVPQLTRKVVFLMPCSVVVRKSISISITCHTVSAYTRSPRCLPLHHSRSGFKVRTIRRTTGMSVRTLNLDCETSKLKTTLAISAVSVL